MTLMLALVGYIATHARRHARAPTQTRTHRLTRTGAHARARAHLRQALGRGVSERARVIDELAIINKDILRLPRESVCVSACVCLRACVRDGARVRSCVCALACARVRCVRGAVRARCGLCAVPG